MSNTPTDSIPTAAQLYQQNRRRRWDTISDDLSHPGRRSGRFYHELLQRHYRLLVPPGLTILELGCAHGDLLNALQPAKGVGVDFSFHMIRQARRKYPHLNWNCADAHQVALSARFDVIILSDLANDLWDVQAVLDRALAHSHAGTRIILNFFNNMWRLPAKLARRYRFSVNFLEQNWLAPADIINLLHLAGYEPIRLEPEILCPVRCPGLAPAANRFLVKVPPFQWFSLTNFIVARPAPPSISGPKIPPPSVSIIIPARNEAGNIEEILRQTDIPGYPTELVFVEGGSSDGTYETIRDAMGRFPEKNCRLVKQPGTGKADAVRKGFLAANGDILIILDADLTVTPADLPRFVEALVSGKGELINGGRLVYPLEGQSMRFLNMAGNKIFSLVLSWLLGQSLKDTLCGTKALWKKDYELMRQRPDIIRPADPFGDFELLFSAAALNLTIVDLPIRYRKRNYGSSKIQRVAHGWRLLRMIFFAARKIKFQ